jgi:hypothetical protein
MKQGWQVADLSAIFADFGLMEKLLAEWKNPIWPLPQVAESNLMGLDLLPILPCALPSGSAVAVVGQRARLQQYCQNSRFFLLIQCL